MTERKTGDSWHQVLPVRVPGRAAGGHWWSCLGAQGGGGAWSATMQKRPGLPG